MVPGLNNCPISRSAWSSSYKPLTLDTMSENNFLEGSENEDAEENCLTPAFFCRTLKLSNFLQKNLFIFFFSAVIL